MESKHFYKIGEETDHELVVLDVGDVVDYSRECDFVENILIFARNSKEAEEIAERFQRKEVGEGNLFHGQLGEQIVCVQ